MAGEIVKSVDVLVCVNTGTDVTPEWTPVGGQKDAKLHEERDTIETTHKLTGGGKTYEYGEYGWTVDCGGLYCPSDAAFGLLRTAIRNKQTVLVRIKEEEAYVLEGKALVTSQDVDAPHGKEATFACKLLGTGVLTENPV